jgi:hypothetical protein
MSAGNSVVFNGCEIRSANIAPEESGAVLRVHIAFQPSDPVMQAMGWDAFPECIPSGPLTGRLAATHIILTPTDKKLKGYEMQFGVNEVRDFKFTSETNDEGHIIRRNIKATVTTSEAVEAHVGNWIRKIGTSSAVAKIGYTVQQQLPGTEVVDDKQKVLQMRPAAEEDSEPVSANDLNAMGSGREKKKRTRGEMSAEVSTSDDAAARSAVEKAIDKSLQ